MKQYEAVLLTLDKLGGQATLAELYQEVLKVEDCKWETRTPFASIRRIVQVRPEIFKVRPGLWALRSYQKKLGLVEYKPGKTVPDEVAKQNHSYFQGVLVMIGNLRGLATFVPNQDKNKLFVNKPLKDLRTIQQLPVFSHELLVQRCSTVDVTWFNSRLMPHSFFEVEHSTNIQDSLMKFHGLQDFSARMIIVADDHRRPEFEHKIKHSALSEIRDRVKFQGYSALVRQYENEVFTASLEFAI